MAEGIFSREEDNLLINSGYDNGFDDDISLAERVASADSPKSEPETDQNPFQAASGSGEPPGEIVKKRLSYGSFDDSDKPSPYPTPLPKWKLLICCTIQLSEGVVLTQVLPYLPFMVQELMDTEDDTDPLLSIYTGLLAASFAWAGAVTSHFWGWMSDKYGRRPILWLGLVGNIITIPLFGFTDTLWMAFVTRSACGLLNGNVGVVRTYVSEIVDKSNRAKGFGYLVLSFNLGFIVGPALGGPLYGTMDSIPLFKKFPYAPPCIMTTMFSVIVLIPAYLKLDETHFPRSRKRTYASESSRSSKQSQTRSKETTTATDSGSEILTVDLEDDSTEHIPLIGGTRRRRLSLSQLSDIGPIPIEEIDADFDSDDELELVKSELYSNSAFWVIAVCQAVNAFMIVAEKTVMPLWAKIDIEDGGWEWSADLIGYVQAIGGIGTIFMTSVVFHRITEKYGYLNVFRVFMLPPICVFILWPLYMRVEIKKRQFILMLFVELLLGFCQGALFSTTFVLVNACVHPALLGRANGIAQALISFIRGLGPAIGGILFGAALEYELQGGWGTNSPFLNRSMVFFMIAIVAIMNTALSFWIPPKYNDPPDRKSLL